ncbi:MAG TPA: SDR family NAD(P)-dependent oxidoreductase [Rubrobacter sp.]
MKLKPVGEQVVVVMGASSGIGRETALRLAKRGAKMVVAARSEAGLRSLEDDLRELGGEVTTVVADVCEFAGGGRRSESRRGVRSARHLGAPRGRRPLRSFRPDTTRRVQARARLGPHGSGLRGDGRA